MNKTNLFSIIIIIFSFAAAIFLYPQMPERMASHWDSNGQINGYMSRFWGLFLMPLILIMVFLLFWVMPKIDPLKENIQRFKKQIDWFVFIVMAMLFYVYILSLAANLGLIFNFMIFFSPALAVLFYFAGILIQKTRRNYFIGIRTPWTLASDAVWEKTHRVGGTLFKILGAIVLLGVFFPQYSFFAIIFFVIFILIFSFVYSYWEWKKQI
jgi:uncharacterized membrane protein